MAIITGILGTVTYFIGVIRILKKDYAALTSNAAVTYTANDLNQCDSTTYPTEAFTYDDDGNLTQDDTFDYTWDAENRLIRVETRIDWGQSSTAYEVGDKHVYFSYDYMGRRVCKRVETFNGTSWPETGDELFVYDGWNVVMVLNANEQNEVMREYTWGLDLSGTVHGAGGIGGLLACYHPTGGDRYWYFYDANGNVGQVLDATSTNNITLAAHYEYDPYGNLIHSSGPYADANPVRFSTKWFDPETGLGNWGYRYYSPRLGRWISRDPIGEKGGLNLCVFALNGPTNHVDALGFQALPPDSWYPAPTETTCPAEIYVYIDGHGCKAVDNNTGESFYTGQIGKGDKGCNSGDFVSPKDVKQATDTVLRQYDATELAKAKVVLVLRTCGMGNHVPEMRQLASMHRSIKTVCGCTSKYWATGGWGWCWSKWVCTNVNGY